MKGIILEAGSPESCHPVTSTRSLGSFPVANVPLVELLTLRLKSAEPQAKPEARDA